MSSPISWWGAGHSSGTSMAARGQGAPGATQVKVAAQKWEGLPAPWGQGAWHSCCCPGPSSRVNPGAQGSTQPAAAAPSQRTGLP